MKYAFTLHVSNIELTDNYEDRLFDAGCSDALIAVIDNALYLDFDREALSLDAAVESAKQDVARAGGRVIEVLSI
jgi:hypothetical protein